MSVLAMITADLPIVSGLTGGWASSTDRARTGSKSFYAAFRGVNDYIQGSFATITPAAIYFRVATNLSQADQLAFYMRFNVLGPSIWNTSRFSTDITIRNATTNLITLTDILVTNIWQVWELKATATTIEVRLNGAEIYSGSGLTVNLTNLNWFRFSGQATVQTVTAYVDDIIIRTDAWPGLGGLYVLEPSGAGTHQDWTGALPTLTTDPEVANTKHTFLKAALPANALNISAAGVCTQARVTGHGYGALKPLLGEAEGAVVAQSISSQYNFQLYQGSWAPAAFDALEVGVASA